MNDLTRSLQTYQREQYINGTHFFYGGQPVDCGLWAVECGMCAAELQFICKPVYHIAAEHSVEPNKLKLLQALLLALCCRL